MFFLYFLLYTKLIPGSIFNKEFELEINDSRTENFLLQQLKIGKNYEVRVSWPSTSPAKILFYFKSPFNENSNPRISDEKIMFLAIEENQFLDIKIIANGVPRKGIENYAIPINISLEELHYGLTKHVWKLIFYTFPILIAFIIFQILIF